MLLRALGFALAVALSAPALAEQEDIRVIGDSIGEGVHMATNLPSPANRFNVAIYTDHIFDQIKAMPRGATVVMSLGTNDAVGGAGAMNVKARVDKIVDAAAAQGVKLVWLGPPCVRKDWQTYSKKLDELLAAQLAGGKVTYVSLQDPAFCEAGIHAGDGVHFTMAGYRLMWQKAADAAGLPVQLAAAASAPTPAASAAHTHPKHHKHKKLKPASAADAPK